MADPKPKRKRPKVRFFASGNAVCFNKTDRYGDHPCYVYISPQDGYWKAARIAAALNLAEAVRRGEV